MTDNSEITTPEAETTPTSTETETETIGEPPGEVTEGGTREERRDERTRGKLRAAEQERDRFRDALVPHVRTAVEDAARAHLSDPAALWLLPDLDPLTLLDDDMGVDETKVAAAVKSLRERLPSAAKRFTGSADGGARPSTATGTSWGAVLQSR